jgi:MoxR-like ATPase
VSGIQSAGGGGDAALLDKLRASCERVRAQIAKVVVGQQETVDHMLIAILAGGHAILEGVPGLAKTLLVETLARSLSLTFARIQFTPDLMPSDITGTEIMDDDRTTHQRSFRFVPGPVFRNIVLADEVNRAPPKTQAALLEAMQERQVSAGGVRHGLPRPFFVFATQNPIEQEGTYPLPEAQLDRFLLKISIGYPSRETEREVYRLSGADAAEEPERVLDGEEILALQALVRRIPVSDVVLDYAVSVARATRPGGSDAHDAVKKWVEYGVGPRGGQALVTCARARAALMGRPAVEVDDIRALAAPVFRHRIVPTFVAEADGQTPDSIVSKLLEVVPLHAPDADHDRLRKVLRS